MFRIGRWITLLRNNGVEQAIIAGRVAKTRMHDPLRLVREVPDWRTVRLWYTKLRHDRRSSKLLAAVADDLASMGIELLDSTTFVPESIAREGVLGGREPTAAESGDIDFGWPVLTRLAGLDIGQSVAVADGIVLACEALEGTDEMIQRAGPLNRGRWTFLKAATDDHDMRFDVPAIGPKTISGLSNAGATCCALRAGRVIILDRTRTLAAADEAGIAIVGVR